MKYLRGIYIHFLRKKIEQHQFPGNNIPSINLFPESYLHKNSTFESHNFFSEVNIK